MPEAQPGQEQRMVTDAMLQLVRNAYEEGVEDGIEWQAELSHEPQPQWIDSVARVELLKATRPTADLGEDGELVMRIKQMKAERAIIYLS